MAPFDVVRFLGVAAVLVSLSFSRRAASQSASARDGGSNPRRPGDVRRVGELRWHGSRFFWDHTINSQTVGLGQDYQSWNPTYGMMFRLAPRYYILEKPALNISVRAHAGLLREFTNSDTTTQRGEWTFLDTELWLAEVATLSDAPDRQSNLILRAPLLVLPTSRVSYKSGRTLGLGFGVGFEQQAPLRGEGAAVLPSLFVRPRVVYTYQFADAVVATSDEIDRVRLDPEGRALPSDQLTGAALPQHQVSAALGLDTRITERLAFTTEFGMRYARGYALPESVQLCAVLATGCASVSSRPERPRWGVQTLFMVSLDYSAIEYLDIGVSYSNLALQLGADGRRRNLFYSPFAQVALGFTVALDLLYQRATGGRSTAPSHTAARPGTPHF